MLHLTWISWGRRSYLTLISFLLGYHITQASDPTLPTSGTRRMRERLEQIAKEVNPMAAPFMSRERVGIIQKMLSQMPAGPAVDMRPRYANELLNAGRSLDALQEFNAYEEFLRQQAPSVLTRNKRLLRMFQAMCHLRIAEQQNCLNHHTTESCLIPIRPGGVHKIPDGSRAAVRVLTDLLSEFPDDLAARWLLNLAYMTLGEYPDKVPARYLVPPSAFESDYDIKRFPDVAGALGVDVNDLSGGSILEDFDGDGDLDIMASSLGLTDQLRYFRNNGDGTFTDRTAEAGLIGEFGGLNILQTDYNNDGWADVLVLRGAWMRSQGRFPNSLLRNRGDGAFDDVTESAGLLSFHPTQTAAWLDYNSDGWLDLFIGNESTEGDPHPCELFRNNRDGTFTETAAAAGVDIKAFVKGVVSGDFNNDDRPDLYLSIMYGPNVLFRNEGPPADKNGGADPSWKFTDVAAEAGVTDPFHSFPCWFFDYDNDGWQDLFVSGYRIRDVGDVAADYLGLPSQGERAKLYRNQGNGAFADVSRAAGVDKVLLSMGSNYGDLDNDGWLDFYIGTGNPELSSLMPNRMFRNADGKSFVDVTASGGFGHLQKGHGVSFGDLDHDGDQDIYQVMGGAYTGDIYRNVLFENPGHGRHWLTVKLEGVRANRAALGARIEVKVETPSGPRTIYKTVSTGSSFGASPLRQEIGLGNATSIRQVEVRWPKPGGVQRFDKVAMNRAYRLVEGQTQPIELPLKRFQFARKSDGAHAHP